MKILLLAVSLLFIIPSFGKAVIELRTDGKGNLVLSGDIDASGTTVRDGLFRRRVQWRIEDPNILSFTIVPKNTGQRYIFNLPLPGASSPSLERQIIFLLDPDWEYSIQWIAASGPAIPLDPKIAVKPGFTIFLTIAGLLVALFGAFFGARAFRMRRQEV